jgi:WhiB family transcriptional regulator, redox-sensing transcriptional regulator
MAPMQWPGTPVVLERASSSEYEAAEQSLTGNVTGQGPDGGDVTVAGLLGGIDLPCQDDPELFFAEAPDDVELAKSLCMGCAARMTCLTGALQRREPWGVWGGELFLRGEVVPYKRPRGRPRKTTVAA